MANSTIPNLPIFAGTPSGTEPMETVQSSLSVQIPSQKIADLATIVIPLTKTAMDGLVSASQVSSYKLYLITNADSSTRRLLVKGLTTTTLEDTAIDMSTGEVGTYVLSTDTFTATSGGSQDLEQTLILGNTSGANDIEFDATQGLLFANTSRLREGTIDAGLGGLKGIAQICGAGYELKWENGRLYVMGSSGNTIRQSLYNFATIPTATDDFNLGYAVGSLWTLDDGTVYECTFAGTFGGDAVWAIGGIPDLQQVLDAGNVSTQGLRIQDGAGNEVTIGDYYVQILNPLGGIAVISSPTLDESVTFELPDKPAGTETFAMLSDIVAGSGTVTSIATSGLISGGTITTSGTITTLMATNKLVGRYSASTGVMEEITIGSGLTLTGAGTLNNTATPTPLGYYGAFQDNTSQTAASINTAYPVKFNTTDLTNGVSVVNDGSSNPTRVTLANTGIYNIQFSLQLEKTGGSGNMVADIWIRKNGVDIPYTTGKVVLTGSVSASPVIAAWNYVLDLTAGDYVQLMWSTSNTNVEIIAAGATPPHPAIPSSILTVTQQSGIMAGTGITAINSLTGAAQTMAAGTSGTDFAISSTGTTHTFNLPTASASNRGALSSADWTAFNSLNVENLSLQDGGSSIAATTYTLELYAQYAYTINQLKIISAFGTCTVAVKINGVDVTGISAVSVSSTIATANASAANTVAVGDKITLVTTSNSALTNLQASLKTTRI
jgi:hypothetical protein